MNRTVFNILAVAVSSLLAALLLCAAIWAIDHFDVATVLIQQIDPSYTVAQLFA